MSHHEDDSENDSVATERERALFFDVAHEGAQVRAIAESLHSLPEFAHPRSIIVLCTDSLTTAATRAVVRASEPLRVPVLVVKQLPAYVGALDVVLGVTEHGDHPEFAQGMLSAYRRGATTLFLGPQRGPITEDVPGFVFPSLPATAGFSPARVCAAVYAVVEALNNDPELVRQRLYAAAEEIDEVLPQYAPEKDELTNQARQLRLFIGQSRCVHSGVGAVGEAAAELAAAILSASGLSSGAVSMAELKDAQGDSPQSEDLFYDPYLDGPATLLPLKTIVWISEATGTPTMAVGDRHTWSMSAPQSSAGTIGALLVLSVMASALVIYQADI